MEFDTDQAAEVDTAYIDDAIAGTENLDAVPLTEHVGRFDAVHAALNEALTSIDTD
ncbi:hypothetical protein [Actinophytocola glycyrrhizae]|uniref:FXSXX-COOH protein n=1 Tax=Actinophytocola glycyrrhizae TaxID=2044873 RepID=A0ABV9SE35_9PSEU